MTTELTIGCIGQGYVGKNYADDLEDRGYQVIRYALEEPYINNRDSIAGCDIVFIGVPTPTTAEGFDDSIVRAAIELVGVGKTAVIKSTIVPGTTLRLQKAFPDRTVLYSPEFLSETTARADVRHPFASIVGVAHPEIHQKEAERVLAILPAAPFSRVMTSTEAELFKYAHNSSGYVQIVFFNLLYDLTKELGQSWDTVASAIAADPYISNRYAQPVHKSGRGAGGHCFIKDFAALKQVYAQACPADTLGQAFFAAAEAKNIELLTGTGKDLDLLRGVYAEPTT